MTRPSRKVMVYSAVAGVLALVIAIQLADGTDVIDLPAWANIRGVDVPLIGNTDRLGCKLSGLDGADLVQIRIVDGDETTYADFEYVFRNGDLVDAGDVVRVDVETFVVPGVRGEEQFYSISQVPDRIGRVFCASITLE